FYDNPNALRDYFRDIGRMVLAAEGRKANDSHADCYQYFCVPEYGTANGRLHFHAVHFMRTLPTGSVDPNFGRRVRNRRQLNSLQNTWPYGYSMPIAVRYTSALTVKLSKYNVDDVALGVCKTGAEEAGVTEVRTSLSEKKFELWREIKV